MKWCQGGNLVVWTLAAWASTSSAAPQATAFGSALADKFSSLFSGKDVEAVGGKPDSTASPRDYGHADHGSVNGGRSNGVLPPPIKAPLPTAIKGVCKGPFKQYVLGIFSADDQLASRITVAFSRTFSIFAYQSRIKKMLNTPYCKIQKYESVKCKNTKCCLTVPGHNISKYNIFQEYFY